MSTDIAIVFSWDPRSKAWVRERGPEDAARPPAAPIDMQAVQTYFLDPQNGHWTSTILGPRARMFSEAITDGHRAPTTNALAVGETQSRADKAAGSRRPLAAGVGLLVLLASAAIVASATILGPRDPAAASSTGPVAPAAATAPSASSPTPGASVEVTSAPAPEPPTVAPAPRLPQTIRLSVRLKTGTQIVYSGPSTITQGSDLRGVFSVVLPPGQPYESLTVFLGDPDTGAMTSAIARPDINGNIVLSISGRVPRGAQPLRVNYGLTPGYYTLGTIAVQ
jgi:hypothetical protein